MSKEEKRRKGRMNGEKIDEAERKKGGPHCGLYTQRVEEVRMGLVSHHSRRCKGNNGKTRKEGKQARKERRARTLTNERDGRLPYNAMPLHVHPACHSFNGRSCPE